MEAKRWLAVFSIFFLGFLIFFFRFFWVFDFVELLGFARTSLLFRRAISGETAGDKNAEEGEGKQLRDAKDQSRSRRKAALKMAKYVEKIELGDDNRKNLNELRENTLTSTRN